ncbi:alpha/beta hydrolase [Paracrocinitomix mangrovi]|uniref:alpha/beta hydrolase n=1 Tax=Paracrocinitomix mangrovi TaxID=2862509 RepID=UPI001C8E3B2A|nr:alpha/beta fold hydrolase [Paracrocinitomix mangrovi]UKN01542.1 alpha/beta hydrolase [Paracrocinitomix mangrovi]
MQTKEHHIAIKKTARYFTLGEFTEGKNLIIALHGYGYLAQFFIRKFNGADFSKFVVVCPEGLHRFYQSGTDGRVGASWMTKEDRLTDIKDYINYLDDLLDELKKQCDFSSITIIGFSQGGATASRWLAYGKHSFDKFVLWATVFPPDMEKEYTEKFHQSKNYFVFGNNDEYYSPEKVEEHYNALKSLNIQFEMLTFEGNHNIHEETFLKIIND